MRRRARRTSPHNTTQVTRGSGRGRLGGTRSQERPCQGLQLGAKRLIELGLLEGPQRLSEVRLEAGIDVGADVQAVENPDDLLRLGLGVPRVEADQEISF